MSLIYNIFFISLRIKIILKRLLPQWLQDILRYFKYPLRSYEKLVKNHNEKKEARRISQGIGKGIIKKVLIVYDNLCSPPTYGDYIGVIFLARYFTSQDIAVTFVIVDEEYRSDWCDLNIEERKKVVMNYINIANLLLDPKLASVEALTSTQLQARVRTCLANGIDVPFLDNVISRVQVYSHTFNTLNNLCARARQNHLDRFLLTFDELSGKVTFTKPNNPYITWHCRYSVKWGLERNTGDEEFLRAHTRLKSLCAHYSIMVVSDTVGCNYFRQIARQYNLDCIFSKDYSDSLMGDGALILGSAYFFEIKGGGINLFPIFSKIPYEIVINTVHEREFIFGKLTSWASKDQLFRRLSSSHDYLPTLAIPISSSELAS